jgi:hypothetical protein
VVCCRLYRQLVRFRALSMAYQTVPLALSHVAKDAFVVSTSSAACSYDVTLNFGSRYSIMASEAH